MKRASSNSAKYNAEFETMKPLVLQRSKGVCEAAPFVAKNLNPCEEVHKAVKEFLLIGCEMKVVHVHHRKYRSRGGTNALTNLLGVCRSHHDWTHAHGGFGQAANLLRLALSAGEDETL